ncbi:MAG: hypothetical protein ACRDN9_18765 [Streptosporangiaceae bacterium]
MVKASGRVSYETLAPKVNATEFARQSGVGKDKVLRYLEAWDGDDPGGYALAVNITRRHLTKGQIAMIAARAYRVSSGNMRDLGEEHSVSATGIAKARTVLDYAVMRPHQRPDSHGGGSGRSDFSEITA